MQKMPPEIKMRVDSLEQLIAWQPPPVDSYIGSNLLLPKSRLILFGLWETYKTMLSIDLAFSIASGCAWAGFPTKIASVLTYQSEISRYMYRRRLLKYMSNGTRPVAPMYYICEETIKLDRDYDSLKLDHVLSVYKPSVIIIDPIYKALAGNIILGYDVNRMLDNLDLLMNKYNLAIVLVGHTRKPARQEDLPQAWLKNWGAELMGSSYFQDWTDTAIAIEKLAPYKIRLHFAKARHAEDELPPRDFSMDRATLHWSPSLLKTT